MNNYNLSYFGYIESEGKWVRWATNWFYHDDTNMTQKDKIGFYELSKTQYCCLINDENRLVMYMCPTTGTLTTLNYEEVAKTDILLPLDADENLINSAIVVDSSTIIFHVQGSNRVYMFNGSGFSGFDLKLNLPALELKYSQRTGKYFAFCMDGVFTTDNIMNYFTPIDTIPVTATASIMENDNAILLYEYGQVYTSSDAINWELQYDQIPGEDPITITKLGNIFVIYNYESPKELYYSDTAGKNWKKYTLMTGEELFDGDSIKETKISITEDHAYIRYYPNSDKHARYYVSEDLAEWRETNVPCKEDTTLFEMSAFPCGLFIY